MAKEPQKKPQEQAELFEVKEAEPQGFEAQADGDEQQQQQAAPQTPSEEDQAAEQLRKQVEDLRKTAADAQARAEQAAKAQAEAIRQAQEQQARFGQLQQSAIQDRLLAVNNAIAAATAEAEKAQSDLIASGNNSDFQAMADAQRRLARAEANLATLENGKTSLEEEVQRQKAWFENQQRQVQLQQQQQQQQGDQLDRTNLPETAKKWLRSHPEYLNDQRKNAKIQALHWDVLDEGHSPFSDAYFESMETKLGLRTNNTNNMSGTNQEQNQQQAQQQRTVPVSAPVTRDPPNPGGGKPSSQIRLTAQEREAAKMAGITESEYAKQKQKMAEAKQQGLLQ